MGSKQSKTASLGEEAIQASIAHRLRRELERAEYGVEAMEGDLVNAIVLSSTLEVADFTWSDGVEGAQFAATVRLVRTKLKALDRLTALLLCNVMPKGEVGASAAASSDNAPTQEDASSGTGPAVPSGSRRRRSRSRTTSRPAHAPTPFEEAEADATR